jgi:Arc/MetJ family transcription regulator
VRLLAAELPQRKAIGECRHLRSDWTMCIFWEIYTHEAAMRTNIDIDDELMAQAMKATGQRTKKAAVEEALRQVIRIADQKQALENLRGIGWDGDLDEVRGRLRTCTIDCRRHIDLD